MSFLSFSERFRTFPDLFVRQLDNSFAQVEREFRKKSSNVRFFTDASANPQLVYLPFGPTVPDRVYFVVKTDAGPHPVTIIPFSDATVIDTIEGDSFWLLPNQYDKVTLVYDGGVWFKF